MSLKKIFGMYGKKMLIKQKIKKTKEEKPLSSKVSRLHYITKKTKLQKLHSAFGPRSVQDT